MGLKWDLDGSGTPQYMVDTRLCFGGRKCPGIFNRLTQAVRRFICKRGYDIVAMLDDMLLICETKEECIRGLEILITLLRELGFSISWKKVTIVSQQVVFLGVHLDSVRWELSLPEEKIRAIKDALLSFCYRKRASKRQLSVPSW